MPTPDIGRVVVMGAGAVGGSIGGLLHHGGVAVQLIARGPHGRGLAERGLRLGMPGQQLRLPIPVVASARQLRPRPCEVRLHGAPCAGVLDSGDSPSGASALAEAFCAALRARRASTPWRGPTSLAGSAASG